jgi:hypothetical protein
VREADEILPSLMDAIDFPGDGRQQAVFGGDRLRAGGVLHVLFQSTGLQLVAEGGGTTVLPHDGVVDRLTCLTVPRQGRFLLVGDAYAGHVGRFDLRLYQYFLRHGELGTPDFVSVVLHPGGLGEELGKFLLGSRYDVAVVVEDAGAAGGSCPGLGLATA